MGMIETKGGYIDNYALMENILKESFRFCREPDYLQIIKNQPAADVIPVVRCERCQSWDHGYCHTLKVRMDPCDFCSYGKGKE